MGNDCLLINQFLEDFVNETKRLNYYILIFTIEHRIEFIYIQEDLRELLHDFMISLNTEEWNDSLTTKFNSILNHMSEKYTDFKTTSVKT